MPLQSARMTNSTGAPVDGPSVSFPLLKGQPPVGLLPTPSNPGATAVAPPGTSISGVTEVSCSYLAGGAEHRFTASDPMEIVEVTAIAMPSQGGHRMMSIALRVFDPATRTKTWRPAVLPPCESHPAC